MSEQVLSLKAGLITHDWLDLDDEAPLPDAGRSLLSLERWLREGPAAAPGRSLGLKLANTCDVESLDVDLDACTLIALEFPSFTDGRAFSQARLLRERLGFRGEIRACGDILSDQLLYLARCGFDSVAPADPTQLGRAKEALSEFSIAYQPSDSGPRLRLAL